MNLSDSIASNESLTHIAGSVFEVASIILFATILVAINKLRSGFSASRCFLLGVLVFLFAIAVSVELRSLILQDLFAPFLDSLSTPFG